MPVSFFLYNNSDLMNTSLHFLSNSNLLQTLDDLQTVDTNLVAKFS